MRALLDPGRLAGLDELVAAGDAAHAAGLDGVFLEPTPALPAPLVAAAALAARVPGIRVATLVEVGRAHPFALAEEAATVDVASGGRLILVVVPAAGCEERCAEVLDLLRTAFAARPFSFEGATWRVPARLPANLHSIHEQARLMPVPVQPRFELWGAGEARDVTLARGLGYLAGADAHGAALEQAYRAAERALGAAAIGAPRARRERLDADPVALVERLRAGRREFGQDWAVIACPPDRARELAAHVLPRVQLDRLPPGLEPFWDEALGEAG
jgi:alkanesulfonate monooxygenase SsuD/methylene tetrahydromethanopterin reductase-like flavin-dependent oxidoreductase (luciferase family)